ncbi:MAG TPA: nucleotidyltransferase family protein [Bacteroidales bacterium]
MDLQEITDKIKPVLLSYGVSKAGIFGSYARNKANESSDVDIVVRLGRPMSLLQFAALKNSLEDILQKRVDLVEYDALKARLKDHILMEEEPVL